MYLSARKYLGNWSHGERGEQAAFERVMKAVGVSPTVSPEWSPHLFVEICVGYWRKANAVHGWFVSNCQDGNDDCLPHPVSRKQLEALLKDCEEALATRQGSKNLPTTAGFFFGETDYGPEYWDSLSYTVQQIQGVLRNNSLRGFEFCYRSSW